MSDNFISKLLTSPLRIGLSVAVLLAVGLLLGNILPPIVKTTHKLKATTLGVEQIKDIGELISAEYYGEIIHSLSEGFRDADENLFKTAFRQMAPTLKVIYKHHEAAYDKPEKKQKRIWKEVLNTFQKASPDLERSEFFHLMRLNNRKHRDINKRNNEAELDLLMTMYRDTSWANFIQGKEDALKSEIKAFRGDRLSGIDIHYLCRGWVKAGYDLSALSKGSITYEDSTMRISGIDPHILAADINPWFIPPHGDFHEGMPGYQLLQVKIGKKTGTRVTFEEVTDLDNTKSIPFELIKRAKKTARIELIQESIERGLFASAQSSAEESLLQLALMLDPTNKKGIKEVEIIHTDTFNKLLEEIEGPKKLNFETLDALDAYIRLE